MIKSTRIMAWALLGACLASGRAPLCGQTLVPHHEEAAERLVGAWLHSRAGAGPPGPIRLVFTGSDTVRLAFEAALARAMIPTSGARSAGPVLRVVHRPGRPHGRLSLRVGAFHQTVEHGEATWLATPPAPAAIRVVGGRKSSPSEAADDAERRAALRLARRVGARQPDAALHAELERARRRVFVAREVVGSLTLYQAHLEVWPEAARIRALTAEYAAERRWQGWRPWVLAGGTMLLAILTRLLYLWADLRTLGRATRPLAGLFGILFVLGVLCIWSQVP
jgi:hypothetical protein